MKSIKVIAKEYTLSTRTLRYYEELGILKPTRSHNGMRHYPKREDVKIKLVIKGKKYGFSLEEIKEMILLVDLDRSGVKQLERTIEYGQQKLQENIIAGRTRLLLPRYIDHGDGLTLTSY